MARATTFVVSDLDTGRGRAHGLICADARYCSLAWLGVDRLDRRFVAPADWAAINRVVDLPRTLLPSTHVYVRALLDFDRRAGRAVQWVAVLPITLDPGRSLDQLDTLMRALTGRA